MAVMWLACKRKPRPATEPGKVLCQLHIAVRDLSVNKVQVCAPVSPRKILADPEPTTSTSHPPGVEQPPDARTAAAALHRDAASL